MKKKYTPHLPQYKVQVRGVVDGWPDINHCIASQRQIRAIHPQPYPIGRIPCKMWERGQVPVRDARPDVGVLFRPFETSVV